MVCCIICWLVHVRIWSCQDFDIEKNIPRDSCHSFHGRYQWSCLDVMFLKTYRFIHFRKILFLKLILIYQRHISSLIIPHILVRIFRMYLLVINGKRNRNSLQDFPYMVYNILRKLMFLCVLKRCITTNFKIEDERGEDRH